MLAVRVKKTTAKNAKQQPKVLKIFVAFELNQGAGSWFWPARKQKTNRDFKGFWDLFFRTV